MNRLSAVGFSQVRSRFFTKKCDPPKDKDGKGDASKKKKDEKDQCGRSTSPSKPKCGDNSSGSKGQPGKQKN